LRWLVKRRFWALVAAALLGMAAFYFWRSPTPTYTFELIAAEFTRPVFLTHAGDGRLFVVEQPGMIWIIQEDGEMTPFLDIREIVNDADNESGLLSMAFDPAYAQNGFFYVYYSTYDDFATTVTRYHAPEPNRADPASAAPVITIEQPFGNHNGGQIAFGPDGYLYIGLGDGGGAGDPFDNAENPEVLLGKLLRLDVRELPYVIPPDNPFVDHPGYRSEIWAYGLRNPWRFSFDRTTGDLYIADVGQESIEEINFQAAGSRGGQHYGWNAFEGVSVYDTEDGNPQGVTFPIYSYPHRQLIEPNDQSVTPDIHCSVTGGYVYRGRALPQLRGSYIYGDFCSGRVWSLTHTAEDGWRNTDLYKIDNRILSFGEDAQGELYLLGLDGGVWKLVQGAD